MIFGIIIKNYENKLNFVWIGVKFDVSAPAVKFFNKHSLQIKSINGGKASKVSNVSYQTSFGQIINVIHHENWKLR